MQILYLHGLGSKPGGIKPAFLRGQGFEVIDPALPDEDFEESVRIAQQAYDQHHPVVVVGSSRGGAVAMAINSTDTPLVLIAPAWKKWWSKSRVKEQTKILHSEHDQVIPLEDSSELAWESGLPETALRMVGKDHDMTDKAALLALVEAVREAGQK